MPEPKPLIDLSIGCADLVASGNSPLFYTGHHVGIRSQFGPLVANSYTGNGSIRNGIHRGDPGFCGGAVRAYGDFHASSYVVKASAYEEKWLVSSGIDTSTFSDAAMHNRIKGLNVWRWSSARLRHDYAGWIDPTPIGEVIDQFDNIDNLRLVGDLAFARNAQHSRWIKFDLTTMVASPGPVGAEPADDVQPDIQGFTYTFNKVAQGHYKFERSDAVPEPELPKFCPDKKITRKQVAAIVYNFGQALKANNPTLNLWVPEDPHAQNFRDVPPENIFAPAIDALAHANIVAGVPEDQPCDE